jgi:hypothetical protein
MRAQRIIGNNCRLDEIRPLRMDPRVQMPAEVAVRPPIEAAFHRCQIIRHQIRTKLISLVHHRPQRARPRLPAQTIRVPQPARENPQRATAAENRLIAIFPSAARSGLAYAFVSSLSRATRSCGSLVLLIRYSYSPSPGRCLITS